VAKNNTPNPLPLVFSNLLQEFEDVFPDELPPGLPPLCGIERGIDLIPGASLPNKPPYRVNPKETKEIQLQVQQLIDNGHVCESLSPCAIPVILAPNQDGSFRMCSDCLGTSITGTPQGLELSRTCPLSMSCCTCHWISLVSSGLTR